MATSTPRPRRARKARSTTVALTSPADQKLARRGRVLLDLIRRRMERVTEDFYEIGEALAELRDERILRAMGYTSFRHLVEATGVMSATQAFKLVAVTEAMNRTQALRLGVERAYAARHLIAATAEPDSVPLLLDGPPPKAGRAAAARAPRPTAVLTKPLEDMSVSEIQQATREALEARAPRKNAGDVRLARAIQAAARRAGAPSAVVELERRGGEWWATIAVPVDEVVALVDVEPERG